MVELTRVALICRCGEQLLSVAPAAGGALHVVCVSLDEGFRSREVAHLAALGDACPTRGIGRRLENDANFCFVNAALQCVIHAKQLNKHFLGKTHSDTCTPHLTKERLAQLAASGVKLGKCKCGKEGPLKGQHNVSVGGAVKYCGVYK